MYRYWLQRHLAPRSAPLGFASSLEFYLLHARRRADECRRLVRILFVGIGDGSVPLALARALRERGTAACITCIDPSATHVRRAAASAAEQELDREIRFIEHHCGGVFDFPAHDVVIADHFLAGRPTLPACCRSLGNALAEDGVLLVGDTVAPDGGVWPEAETQARTLWARHGDRVWTAPATRRRRRRTAPDLVENLLATFEFELFFGYGGSALALLEAPFGSTLDPLRREHRNLIDLAETLDREAMAEGRYPPARMLSVLRHRGSGRKRHGVPFAPERHLELVLARRGAAAR